MSEPHLQVGVAWRADLALVRAVAPTADQVHAKLSFRRLHLQLRQRMHEGLTISQCRGACGGGDAGT